MHLLPFHFHEGIFTLVRYPHTRGRLYNIINTKPNALISSNTYINQLNYTEAGEFGVASSIRTILKAMAMAVVALLLCVRLN